MSDVELFNFLKRSLGVIIKKMEEAGVFTYISGKDHAFIPEIVVDDKGVEVREKGFLYSIRVVDGAPVKFNIDKPVTDFEWSVVFPGTIKKVGRIGNKLYLKAPAGQKSTVSVEVLKA